MLIMLDRTEKLSCKSDLTKSTVKFEARSVMFPKRYGEMVVREQRSKSE